MARFRLYHVRGDQLIKKILFDCIDTTTNNASSSRIDESYAIDSYSAMASYVVGNSSGTVSAVSNNVLLPYQTTNQNTSALISRGFRNWLDFSENGDMEIGDRLYVNRWDHSHSYIIYMGVSAGLRLFNYYTKDAELVYSVTMGQTDLPPGYSIFRCFPWLTYWGDDNTYTLTTWDVGYWINHTAFLDCTVIGNVASPTSIALAEKFWEDAGIIDTDNPYVDGGETGEGGGDPDRQNWDDASDAITPDALPTKGAMNSGMLKVFSPSETQVLDLTDLLFSYNFFDWLQKNLQNLEELFVSFGVVPFTVTKGATRSVTFLGFDISSFTHPVYLTEASQQYYEFDMGSITLNGSDARIHASDSVFDYSPFSRLGIYLPFIGFQELDIDECRGNTINLKYRIDIISGSTVALIYLNSDKEHCIYQFSGNCLSQIPLGSVDMSGIIAGSINIATAAASAGASGAIASAGDALTAENLNAGDITPTAAALQNSQHAAQVAHGAGTLASATANGIMGMKPNFKHSGAIGSTGGLMAVKQPYLFLTTPREAVPASYQKYCGLPCNITDKLSNFRGYTVVEDIRLNGLVATSAEVEEIYNLLKSGVII